MRISPLRIALASLVFVAALAGALVVLQGGDSSGSSREDGNRDRSDAKAATSDIWKLGDTWVVSVRQDAGAITPDGDSSIATIPFRFEVTEAPTGAGGSWTVQVQQDGAEGPFAAGWKLLYREKAGTMVLHRVAVGTEPPLEAELASIVLGPQFPYEPSYKAPPKDRTVDAAKLLERSTLPPSSLPGKGDADTPGATPPAEAPKLDVGGAPSSTAG